jgi:hypothetical protein
MTALPQAASLIKTENYFPTSTSSASLLIEDHLIGKITLIGKSPVSNFLLV